MITVFIIALVLFCFFETLLIIQFAKKKKSLFLQSTIASLIGIAILLTAIILLKITVPYYVLLLCFLVVLIHNYFGYYLDLYSKSRVFDRYLHAFGSFSFSLLLYYFLGRFIEYGGSRVFRALYIMLLGIGISNIFEILEFANDSTKGTNMQKGLKDTNLDIIFNIAGAFIAAVFAYFIIL